MAITWTDTRGSDKWGTYSDHNGVVRFRLHNARSGFRITVYDHNGDATGEPVFRDNDPARGFTSKRTEAIWRGQPGC